MVASPLPWEGQIKSLFLTNLFFPEEEEEEKQEERVSPNLVTRDASFRRHQPPS